MPNDPFEAIARDLARLRRQVDDLLSVEVPGQLSGYTTTTDASTATLATFTVPASTSVGVLAQVVARRTGGSAGTAEDAAHYILAGTFKNVAGTATQVGSTTVVHTAEDQAGWAAVFDVTGATFRVRVTGALNNNVSWVLSGEVVTISS